MTDDRVPNRAQPAKPGVRRPETLGSTDAAPGGVPVRPAGAGLTGGAHTAGAVGGTTAGTMSPAGVATTTGPGGSWSDSESRPAMASGAGGVDPGPARSMPARSDYHDDEPTGRTPLRTGTVHPTTALGGFGLAAVGLIVGAIIAMLLIGGERRSMEGIARSPTATTSTGAGSGTAGTTTNTRTGTFDDTTNTSPVTPGTAQPNNR